ncbi:SapC [Vreelandella aquamarina]|uniref:SapC n=1 Tax=Vreelandella aquamarina TaxID=77097 RepID=A0A6F8XAS1_9GAMM|nr:SapC family protein [Halomonas meridiana]BCB70775.1 SapC [Halomonas meridiana]
MPQWIALSRNDHAEQHVLPRDGYHHSAKQRVVPVLLAELSKLLPHYALGFIRQGESYQPVAIVGVRENAYLAPDGRWFAPYVPAQLRGYPFALAKSDDGQQVLAIDTAHLVNGPDGEPLFDEQGALSEHTQQVFDFLAQCEKNRLATQQAAEALAKHKLLVPWELVIGTDAEGGTPVKLDGLYRVDEQALNALEPEALAELRGGPLALAYAHLFSTAQHKALADRVQFQAKYAEQGSNAPANLDEVFGEGDDDLEFDFS